MVVVVDLFAPNSIQGLFLVWFELNFSKKFWFINVVLVVYWITYEMDWKSIFAFLRAFQNNVFPFFLCNPAAYIRTHIDFTCGLYKKIITNIFSKLQKLKKKKNSKYRISINFDHSFHFISFLENDFKTSKPQVEVVFFHSFIHH